MPPETHPPRRLSRWRWPLLAALSLGVLVVALESDSFSLHYQASLVPARRRQSGDHAGTIEGDKIDMVLSIEDAASSHEPVSLTLSRVVE